MNFTINDIVDFSRLKANKMIRNEAEFDIRESIAEVTNMFKFQADQHNNEIITEFFNLERVGYKIFSDSRRIQQIVVNLLSNAIKFTKQGQIRIITSLIYKPELKRQVI